MYNPKNIKEETRVIYQDRIINFRILNKELLDHKDKYNLIKHSDGLLKLKPGKIIHIRLYTSTAGITIDGHELNEVHKNFLEGNTPFVILENSGKFAPGNVNYLTFECIEILNQSGIPSNEIKVRISVIQQKALGHSSGMTDWSPNIYYGEGNDIIGPDKRLYNCLVAHTSNEDFSIDLENNYWERQGSLDQGDVDDFEDGLGDPNDFIISDPFSS